MVVGERHQQLFDAGAHLGRADQGPLQLGRGADGIGRVQGVPRVPVLSVVGDDALADHIDMGFHVGIARGDFVLRATPDQQREAPEDGAG